MLQLKQKSFDVFWLLRGKFVDGENLLIWNDLADFGGGGNIWLIRPIWAIWGGVKHWKWSLFTIWEQREIENESALKMKISEQRENWKWIFSLHDRSRLPSSPFWGERDGMDESAQFLGDKFSAPLVFWACKISCIIFCSCLSLEINSQFSYNYFFAPLCLWVRLGWRSDSLEEKRVSSSNDESTASEKLITFMRT